MSLTKKLVDENYNKDYYKNIELDFQYAEYFHDNQKKKKESYDNIYNKKDKTP